MRRSTVHTVYAKQSATSGEDWREEPDFREALSILSTAKSSSLKLHGTLD